MLDQQTLFMLLIFGAAVTVTLAIWKALNKKGDGRIRERLSSNGPAAPMQPKPKLTDMFARIGQAAAKPFMPETREKQSELKRKLGMAGIYAPSAIRMVQGFKFLLLGVGIFGGLLVGYLTDNLLISFAIGGLLGYLLPTFWLKTRIKRQQRALEYGLADALDLMVVCVEAGLAVDAAMQRVGQELNIVHPTLSRELEIAHMETRVGLSRTESLRNLGQRTGSPALVSLASMLIQAERFGTSIANALKVHSDSLRTTRQFRAEEMAAKASVKLSFPLVLFIFPATFITLAGPTIVELMNSTLFN